MSNLTNIIKRAELFAIAKRHAEANRAEMGDQWADEIIEDFRQQGELEVAIYMESVTTTNTEIRAQIEANLLKDFR